MKVSKVIKKIIIWKIILLILFYVCSFSKANYSMKNPEKIGTVYFLCSQFSVLNDFKNSNRKRMKWFDCKGNWIYELI